MSDEGIEAKPSKRYKARAQTFGGIFLTKENCERLRQQAEARNMTQQELIQTLVTIVLEGNLVNAVIDDDKPATPTGLLVSDSPMRLINGRAQK